MGHSSRSSLSQGSGANVVPPATATSASLGSGMPGTVPYGMPPGPYGMPPGMGPRAVPPGVPPGIPIPAYHPMPSSSQANQ